MPRYFLDINGYQNGAQDDEGTVLADEEAGRALALRSLAGIAKDAIETGDQQSWFATLRDVYGNTLYRAKLTLAGRWENEGR